MLQREPAWFLLVAFCLVLVVAALPMLPLPRAAALSIDNGLQLAAALTAAVVCLTNRDGLIDRHRLGWRLLGAGALWYAIGQAMWWWEEATSGSVGEGPSAMDIPYLSFYPLAATGILLLSTVPERRGYIRLGLILDGLLATLASFALAWPTLLDPAFEAMRDLPTAYITIAYPLADVLLVGLTAGILMRHAQAWQSGLGLLFAGFVCILIADLGYATDVFAGTYATGRIIDAAWLVGFLLIAAAVRADLPDANATAPRVAGRLARILPLFAVACVVLAFIIVRRLGADRDPARVPFSRPCRKALHIAAWSRARAQRRIGCTCKSTRPSPGSRASTMLAATERRN